MRTDSTSGPSLPAPRAARPAGRRAIALITLLGVLAAVVLGAVVLSHRSGGPATANRHVPSRPATAVPARPAFAASGVDGGGFQNVVAIDPFDSRMVLAGADVAGVARSTDGGKTWARANRGLGEPAARHVAAILFSPIHRGQVYLAAGKRGTGGIWVSGDGGSTWSKRSGVPIFEGGKAPESLQPKAHPRSTGTLLVADRRTGTIYAGTFAAGLMRSTDDGRSWRTLGLAGQHIRGIALDPDTPDTLYVGTYGSGVFATTSASGVGTFAALAGSPRQAEELRVVAGTVYVAGNTAGVFAGTDGGRHWSRLGGATVPPGPVWESLAAYRTGSTTVLYAGSAEPGDTGTSVLRSTDGGATFSVFLGRNGLRNQVGGPGGPPWWLMTAEQRMLPGRGSYIAADIEVDQRDPRRVIVAGRSGVWGTADAGSTWYPLVRNLDVTITLDAVGDPNVPGRVYLTLMDWTMVTSTDDLRTVQRTVPEQAASVGWSVALDPTTTPSTVFLGAGNISANRQGEVFSSPDPLKGHWTETGLGTATGGKRPLGLAVGYDGDTRVLLAAVQASGLWRKAGDGPWQLVRAGLERTAVTVPLVWHPGDRHAYLYDAADGLLRSSDAGKTWTRVWAHRSNGRATFGLDPSHPDRGYLSVDNELFALSRLSTSAAATKLQVPGRPGPVTVDARGSVLVTVSSDGAAATSQLLRSDDGGANFEPAGDDVYAASAGQPNRLVVTPNGHLVVTLQGTGALVSR